MAGVALVAVRLYTTPRSVTLALPCEVTLPPSVAVVAATDALVGVVTVAGVGATVVVKVVVEPYTVPASLMP
jgi:hypothetical protein